MVEAKFGSLSGGWCSMEVVEPFGLRVWKHIRRGWGVFFKFC
jgi:hypothetical protein